MTEKKYKLELYNLNNKDCQVKFREFTSNTEMLSTVFDGDGDVDILTKRFIKKRDACIASNLRKKGTSKKKLNKTQTLFAKLQEIKK